MTLQCNKPMGIETLANVVKKIMTKAAFEGHFTNHSRRRSSATWLYQSSVPKQVIVDTTSHRSLDGLENYINVHHRHLNEKKE